MYVTYNTITGRVFSWSNKSKTPPANHAEIQTDNYNYQEHWYYDEKSNTFSGPTEADQNEELSIDVRNTRNELLERTDWRFRSDLTPSQAWIDYCQALRDIPLQEGFPNNITWPTPPE